MRPRFVTGLLGQLFVVRWRVFRLTDVVEVREQIARARRASKGPLVYLSLIPRGARTFSDPELRALGNFVADLLHDCESIHHVIDGEGFAASARRSIVTKLAVGAARPGDFFTYATLEEALAFLAPRLGVPAEELLAQARAHDLAFPDRA